MVGLPSGLVKRAPKYRAQYIPTDSETLKVWRDVGMPPAKLAG